jgi:hypothetical protein
MAYLLRFDGINDQCTFPTPLSINLGVDAYSFECRLALSSLPASSLYGIVGRLGTATGFAVTPDGRLAMYGAGSLRYQTSAGLFLTDSDLHIYRLEHDAGGAWRVYRDDLITPVESGTFTTSTIASNMNRIGTATGGSSWLAGDLAYADLQIPVGSQKWDADLSGGTGAILPTVSGTNQGSLVNFTVPDCWIFYDDGGAVTSTIAATWPQLTIATSQTSTTPDTDSAIAFTWPQLSISAEQLTIAPVSTSAAFNWPQLSVSATQSSTAPQFDSAVDFTWPQLTISAEQSAAYSGNAVNFTWPQLSVLANQSATIPDVETAVSFTWPQLTVGVNQITPSDNPEYNFPISGYRNNNQWRFSPFFKQTK